MSGFYIEIMKGLGASSRLFELHDQKPTIPLHGGKVIDDVKQEIRFESVAFGYPDRAPLFNDISFRVPAGSVTAIVGPSGTGKSTIANLVLRLYDPTNGRICIDNIDLKEVHKLMAILDNFNLYFIKRATPRLFAGFSWELKI
jgi:ABC-type multidrug transport system fused ATPase/permease subunit